MCNLKQAKRERLRKEGVTTSVNWRKVSAFVGMYWHRLIGTGMGWFVWDFAFYGNKLFQGTFIKIIHPNAGLVSVRVQGLGPRRALPHVLANFQHSS